MSQAEAGDPNRSTYRHYDDILAVYAQSQEVTAEIELAPVLKKVQATAQALTVSDSVAICLLDITRASVKQVIFQPNGFSDIQLSDMAIDETLAPTWDHRRATVRRRSCSSCQFSAHVQQCITVPLRAGEQTIGALCVMRNADSPPFDLDKVPVLESFAEWAGIAVVNALKFRMAKCIARSERDRIVAHLHDNAAQTLSLLQRQVDEAEEKLACLEVADATRQIKLVKSTVQEAIAQIRVALTDSVQPAAIGKDLIAVLTSCIDAFRETTQMSVEFTFAGDCVLPASSQLQALQIMRETLVNIRRHAHARSVRVGIVRCDEAVELTIADDGIGFDPNLIDLDHHLGVTIMRERARRMGGSLIIDSKPGHGTRIRLSLPVAV